MKKKELEKGEEEEEVEERWRRNMQDEIKAEVKEVDNLKERRRNELEEVKEVETLKEVTDTLWPKIGQWPRKKKTQRPIKPTPLGYVYKI